LRLQPSSQSLAAQIQKGCTTGGDLRLKLARKQYEAPCQIIRQHQLDATLVKSYATDFCGVKTLSETPREQVESFVAHLADWASKDRDALLCQLNSYLGARGAA